VHYSVRRLAKFDDLHVFAALSIAFAVEPPPEPVWGRVQYDDPWIGCCAHLGSIAVKLAMFIIQWGRRSRYAYIC
jgi:hypothetical protein